MTQTKTQSNFRWRWGETNLVLANVEADTVIHTGDLLWLDCNTARPASDVNTHMIPGILETTEEYFSGRFLGVAMQDSPAGSTTPIRVATSGTFQFDTLTPVSEQRLGMSVYPEIYDGDNCMTQSVGFVCPIEDARSMAIGRVSHIHYVENNNAYVAISSAIFNR